MSNINVIIHHGQVDRSLLSVMLKELPDPGDRSVYWEIGELLLPQVAHTAGPGGLPSDLVMGFPYNIIKGSDTIRLRTPDLVFAEAVRSTGPNMGHDEFKPTPRQINHHRVNGVNDALDVQCMDQPGSGGACHEYQIVPVGHNTTNCQPTFIHFQNGPVKEAGVNGMTHETLLAILIDRMEGFQSGEYACHDNQMALDHLQSARLWLHKRTMDRVARNVEGTHEK